MTATSLRLQPTPPTPASLGLPLRLLRDLVLKLMARRQLQRLGDLAAAMGLPAQTVELALHGLRRDARVEVRHRGALEADVSYDLTQAGRDEAAAALDRSGYCGPAPVTLADYAAQALRQALPRESLTRHRAEAAFADLIVPEGVLERVGPALASRRAVLLHGAPGVGKSYLCQQLVRLLDGTVRVPHAILVDDEIVRVFDPLVHRRVQHPARPADDERWVECERPIVITGGELTIDMLELGHDAAAGCYHAPPQLKANGGLFIIDDLGRQRVAPADVFNRWILPLETRHDWLSLRSGLKFQVPFEAALIFSTNAAPQALADEAFLRRIGYKVEVGPLSAVQYTRLLVRACQDRGVVWTPEGQNALLTRHERSGRPLHACTPADLVAQVLDHATYHAESPVLSPAGVVWAWQNHFGSTDARDDGLDGPASARPADASLRTPTP